MVRKYIDKMEASPEERTIRVTVRSLDSLCGHSLVAPKGFEGMTTFEVRFGNKSGHYDIRLAA